MGDLLEGVSLTGGISDAQGLVITAVVLIIGFVYVLRTLKK